MENKSTKRKSDHKISDTVGKIVIIIIVLLFIFLLPDLIYNIRVLLLRIGILKRIAIPDLDNEKYISMMLTIISCCTTGIISFIAYRLSKILGVMEINSQKTKLALLAIRLMRNIEYNSEIIFKMSKDICNDLSNLQCEEIFSEIVTRLYSSHAIDKNEKDICSDYLKLVEKIYKAQKLIDTKGGQDGNEQKLTKQIDKFSDNYFKDSGDILKFNDNFKSIIEKLEQISVGGDTDV
ncbi:hypothetical protein FMM74_016835 [Lachnospiraceae bacterium MD308]|nr:hypothetical protein [Lachnospiraceae bacterium MD308]